MKMEDAETDKEILAEWIDMQLIASLTDKIGRLVYYQRILRIQGNNRRRFGFTRLCFYR